MRVLSCLVLTLFLCACASQSASSPAEVHFLGKEFGKMTPVAEQPDRYVWRSPKFNPKDYSAVILDRTVIWQEDSIAKDTGVSRDELKALARHVDSEFQKTMTSIEFPIKDVAAPRTMRISAALTQIKASKPTLNTVTSVLPVGWLVTLGRKATGSTDPNVGSCSIEIRFSDSVTGETLGLFADHMQGDKYDSANFQALGQAEKASDKWAEMLRTGILRIWGARKN